MADEQETIVPTEQAAPAIETEVETEKPVNIVEPGEDAEQGDGSEADEAEAPEVEYVTLERNGKQYQVPKELEGEFLMQSDYTKKTQATSARDKELEARASALDQQANATEEELKERAVLINVAAQLEQYAKVDWDALEAQDPLGAQKHWRQFQTLQQQAGEVQSRLQTKAVERTQLAQQDLAKRIEETATYAKQNIPGWKPELDDQIVKFAIAEGVPQDFLRKNMSPVLYRILHRAFVGNQTLTKPAAPKPQNAAPVVPLKTVGGKSTPAATKSLTELAKGDDMEAFAKVFLPRMAKR